MERQSQDLKTRILVGFLYRLLVVIGLAGLSYGLYFVSEATIDPQLQVKNAELQTELKRVRNEINALRKQSAALKGEVERLKGDEDEIAYHARNGLGLIRPGEVIYRFDDRAQSDADKE